MLDGWVLAQTLHEAADPDDALPETVAQQVEERRRASQALDTEVRRRDLRRIAQSLKPRVAHDEADTFPARMRALLATDVPRDVGSAWLRQTAPPRRGFRAGGALLQTLRILAQVRK